MAVGELVSMAQKAEMERAEMEREGGAVDDATEENEVSSAWKAALTSWARLQLPLVCILCGRPSVEQQRCFVHLHLCGCIGGTVLAQKVEKKRTLTLHTWVPDYCG